MNLEERRWGILYIVWIKRTIKDEEKLL